MCCCILKVTSKNNVKLTQEPDGTQELAISDLDTQDSGKYSCIVTMKTGETITSSGQVNVAGEWS